MASAKKKLDEKNLKILRELVSLPENKHCFDCKQRGPTYINMTIGSFVCTTCSGMLRGLTPPHRVKSITMATFSPEEIDFISLRGNEYCRNVWLGLCDSDQLSKDEQQIKEFMISKYERKRYYVKENEKNLLNGFSFNKNVPQQVPKTSFLGTSQICNGGNILHSNNSKISKNNLFKSDQVAVVKEFKNSFEDPFTAGNVSLSNQPSMNFANFDNNPIFNSSHQQPVDVPCTEKSILPAPPPPPSEDRYAALKALDSLMKSQVSESNTPHIQSPDWGNSNIPWTHTSVFETSQSDESSETSVNPFADFENGLSNPSSFIGNPFKSDASWPTNSDAVNGFTTSQSLNFSSSKSLWDFNQTPNPFTVNTNGHSISHHSSNPFL